MRDTSALLKAQVTGVGPQRQTALFLRLRNPLLAWLRGVTTSGAPPIRKRKEETVELSLFASLSSTILNMILFSAFNLDRAPAAFTKKQKPLWFHFSGNFVLLGKKKNQTNSTCCLPSSYQGDKLQKDAITFLCKAEQLIEKMVSGKVSRHGLTQKKISSKDIRLNKEGRESWHALTSSLGGTNQQKHTPLDQIQHTHWGSCVRRPCNLYKYCLLSCDKHCRFLEADRLRRR